LFRLRSAQAEKHVVLLLYTKSLHWLSGLFFRLLSIQLAPMTHSTVSRPPHSSSSASSTNTNMLSYALAPHVHPTSRYDSAHDKFYQAFPHVGTTSNKCWAKRPGYKATNDMLSVVKSQGFSYKYLILTQLSTTTLSVHFFTCKCGYIESRV